MAVPGANKRFKNIQKTTQGTPGLVPISGHNITRQDMLDILERTNSPLGNLCIELGNKYDLHPRQIIFLAVRHNFQSDAATARYLGLGASTVNAWSFKLGFKER